MHPSPTLLQNTITGVCHTWQTNGQASVLFTIQTRSKIIHFWTKGRLHHAFEKTCLLLPYKIIFYPWLNPKWQKKKKNCQTEHSCSGDHAAQNKGLHPHRSIHCAWPVHIPPSPLFSIRLKEGAGTLFSSDATLGVYDIYYFICCLTGVKARWGWQNFKGIFVRTSLHSMQ